MTALRSGCLLFYWIQKLRALQSTKPAEALVCARFISYYVLRYHNMFCALMAAFLCQSFGKSTLCLRLFCLTLSVFFKFFFPLNLGEGCWELGRFDLAGNAWVFLHGRELIPAVFSWAASTQYTGVEGLKDIHVPWLILPSCCGQAAFLATSKAVKRSVE